MILVKAIGEPIQKLRIIVASALIRIGATPNILTVIGFLFVAGAGLLFAFGYFGYAIWAMVFASAFDMLDGTVARLSGKTSQFGGFLDSSLDRYGDIAVLGGIIAYYIRAGDSLLVVLGIVSLVGALLVSYTRARAECFVESCHVGFFVRGERFVTVMCSALTGNFAAGLWILAIGTHWTVAVRIHYTWRTLNGQEAPPANSVGGQLYHTLFWDFHRGSLQFDVFALAVAASAMWLPL